MDDSFRIGHFDDRQHRDPVLDRPRHVVRDIRRVVRELAVVEALSEAARSCLACVGKRRVGVGELAIVQLGPQRERPASISRHGQTVVDDVGRPGRNQAGVQQAAHVERIALVNGIAVRVDLQGAEKVCAGVDRTRTASHSAAPENPLAARIEGLEFDPDIECVDRAAGEEMAYLPSPHNHIDPDRFARPDTGGRPVQWSCEVTNLAQQDRPPAGTSLLSDSEAGRGRELSGRANHLGRCGILADRRQSENVERHDVVLQEFRDFVQLALVLVYVRHGRVGGREAMRAHHAILAAGIIRGHQRHVAVGTILRLFRVVERASSLPRDAAGLPVVVRVEAAHPAIAVHRHVQMHFVARGTEFGAVLAHERLHERASMRGRRRVCHIVVDGTHNPELARRQAVQLRILDDESAVTHGVGHMHDGVA